MGKPFIRIGALKRSGTVQVTPSLLLTCSAPIPPPGLAAAPGRLLAHPLGRAGRRHRGHVARVHGGAVHRLFPHAAPAARAAPAAHDIARAGHAAGGGDAHPLHARGGQRGAVRRVRTRMQCGLWRGLPGSFLPAPCPITLSASICSCTHRARLSPTRCPYRVPLQPVRPYPGTEARNPFPPPCPVASCSASSPSWARSCSWAAWAGARSRSCRTDSSWRTGPW